MTLLLLFVLVAFGSRHLVEVHCAVSSGSGRSNGNNSVSLAEPQQFSNGSNQDNAHCYQKTKCQPLSSPFCLDVTLPYKFTSLSGDFSTQRDVHEYLSKWKVVRTIPRCWVALQPVLCTLFLPRCDKNLTFLPTYEMCKITQGPCRLIETHFASIWPDFLKCDNKSMFPTNCSNQYKDLKFNSSAGKCPNPLVPTENSNIWFPGIDGCAFGCRNPHYTKEEYEKITYFIYYGALASLFTTMFTVLSFVVDWKSSNRYPAVIIFYLALCLLISTFGWLLQFLVYKEDMVCRPDKTVRQGKFDDTPSSTLCMFNFSLIYYFSMATLVWFVNLTYAWDVSFKGHAFRAKNNSKTTYFHLVAWSIPFMLTILAVAFGEIDGNHLLGICFVGFKSQVLRIIFIIAPLTTSVLIGVVFLSRSFFTLLSLRNTQARSVNSNTYKRIKPMTLKIALFTVFVTCALLIVFVANNYEHKNLDSWEKSIQNFVACSLNISAPFLTEPTSVPCASTSRPNYIYVIVQLTMVFGTGVAVSSWAWTSQTKETWRRFLLKCLKAHNEPIRAKKHEVIAMSYHNRFNGQRPVLESIHGDPIGMNLTSACSQELSSTFANNFQHLVMRRGAITDQTNNRQHYLPPFVPNNNYHSSYSDISQQRCSLDSFASRDDSRLSIQDLRELQATVKNQRRKTRKEREVTLRSHKRSHLMRFSLRRGSDTSTQSLAQVTAANSSFANGNHCTQSTSTGDLQNGPLMAFPTSPNFHHHLQQQHLRLTSPVGHAHCPLPPQHLMAGFAQSQSQQQSIDPIPSRQRVRKPQTSSLPTFSHGMSEQSHSLSNPFTEKRRPDSRIPYHCPSTISQIPSQANTTPNGTLISPFVGLAGDFFNPLLNPLCPPPQIPYPFMFPPQVNGLLSPHLMGPPSQAGQFSANFNPYALSQQHPQQYSNQFGALNAAYAPHVNQCQNLEDLQALMRERSEHLQLIAPVDSGSDRDDFLPIIISDSEGFFTDGGHRRTPATLPALSRVLKQSI